MRTRKAREHVEHETREAREHVWHETREARNLADSHLMNPIVHLKYRTLTSTSLNLPFIYQGKHLTMLTLIFSLESYLETSSPPFTEHFRFLSVDSKSQCCLSFLAKACYH